MIVILGLLAIAFSTQLLPLTVDMLFIKKGSRAGAVAGLVVGLAMVLVLSPFFGAVAGGAFQGVLATMKKMMDVGAWGLAANISVFVIISLLQRR